ncbi:LysR substrate-binding domain-containing protein [Dictyobacter aurantiacus]|uniref:Transcriptional regulator n=1 Tax=Dictyobacter aurantiacus TaxID=1936993 RepID=A0A401ZQC7_9CHLR|nr:LysR substrate-binding domain-containing protein [Dictyobacter aurantiacus]GCE09083.1 transcriptional regulator [Dictyobacter aurantiacus]
MYNQHVELRHLRYFVAVAEELHFSRAAKKLHIAQPPLSQQIRQLEQILGVRLFERNHHAVMLTNAGQVFLEEALRILEQMEGVLLRVQKAQQGLVGRLDIGFVNSATATDTIIPDVLGVYHQRFPEVEVRLKEMYLQEQLQALQQQRIQVGFAASIPQDIPTEFDSEVIQRVPFVAVFAQQHRFASQPSVMLHSLANEPFIFCQRKSASDLYDRIIQLCGFSPLIKQEVSDVRMLLGLVAANLGVSLLPASAMTLSTQGVVYRPLADAPVDIAVETIVVWRREGSSPLVQEFLVALQEVLRQQKKTTRGVEERVPPGKGARGESHRHSR